MTIVLRNNVLASLAFLLTASAVYAETQNAADIYRQALALYSTPEKELGYNLDSYVTGETPADEAILRYLRNNREALTFFYRASATADCDWEADFSVHTIQLPEPLGSIDQLRRLVLAHISFLAETGDYEAALDYSFSLFSFARHLGGSDEHRTLLSQSTHNAACVQLRRVICAMPPEISRLEAIHRRLSSFSFPATYREHLEYTIGNINKKTNAGQFYDLYPSYFHDVLSYASEGFHENNRRYAAGYVQSILDTLSLPYAEVCREMKVIEGRMEDAYDRSFAQYEDKPLGEQAAGLNESEVVLAMFGIMKPVMAYSVETTMKAEENVLRALLLILMDYAKNGRLPDQVLPDVPRDPFSGEPFHYERTDTGFLLRCRTKDLQRDKIHQWEFIVPRPRAKRNAFGG